MSFVSHIVFMYENFHFSQELEDRLNPKHNGSAQSQTTSLYGRVQGKTFFTIPRCVCMCTVNLLCPVTSCINHKKIVIVDSTTEYIKNTFIRNFSSKQWKSSMKKKTVYFQLFFLLKKWLFKFVTAAECPESMLIRNIFKQ